MIVRSLLDTDLYKFTMMQVVLHHFPGAQVEYRFKCRTEGVDLTSWVEEIGREVADLCQLRLREEELAYLRGLRFMKSDFVDFLALFHFNEKYIRIARGAAPGEIEIAIRGPWLHTILYEIPLLAVMHNNRAYHQEVMHLQRMAGRHQRGITRAHIGTTIDNPNIDYAKIAQGMGVHAQGPIANANDLGPAIKRALEVVKRGEPSLIDVVTQPR